MADTEFPAADVPALRAALVAMATETWRFALVFERLQSKLDAGEQQRSQNQYRWFRKKTEDALAQAGLRMVDVAGQPYDPGIAATALNIDEFTDGEPLVVDQMLEPIIMDNAGLVKTGTVILRKK